MAQPINFYMTGDDYAPVISKPSLQQWDNYQIYDISCVDIRVDIANSNNLNNSSNISLASFIAVQSYNHTPIKCNFNNIINIYP
jgi:hypothetical protein